MNENVRLAALKAASKVAFSTLSLSLIACREAPPPEAPVTPADPSKPKPGPIEASKPPVRTCESILASAFPRKGEATSEVKSCCHDALLAEYNNGTVGEEPHHWDCCQAVGRTDNDVRIACTPWGPPVPPRMARRA